MKVHGTCMSSANLMSLLQVQKILSAKNDKTTRQRLELVVAQLEANQN